MKKIVTTVLDWDFSNLEGDCVLGVFRDKAGKELHIHILGFRIQSIGNVRGRRCVQVNIWVDDDEAKKCTSELFGGTLIHLGGEEVVSHGYMSVDWALRKGESSVNGAIRIAKALSDKLDLGTSLGQWNPKGIISWFTVTQHTSMVIDGELVSEEEYLRQKHGLPKVTHSLNGVYR